MRKVRCRSGIKGWRCKLRENYCNYTEFKGCAETWGLHKRIGFNTIRQAWDANPLIEGSVIPSDFRRVRSRTPRATAGQPTPQR